MGRHYNVEEVLKMSELAICAEAFGLFAAKCAELSDYSATLKQIFAHQVLTMVEIQSYQDNWQYEKWIEAELNVPFALAAS